MRAKFIYEKFTDESDPIGDMGIGMKTQIEKWVKTSIRYYGDGNAPFFNINDDATIDVNLSCILIAAGDLPWYINFHIIKGDFIAERMNLTTLRGFPKIVYGDFSVHRNNLLSLEGGPEIVGGTYGCSLNPCLNSLKGIAKVIGGHIAFNNTLGITEKDIPEGTEIGCINNTCIGNW